jgi:hypothetical protein
LSIWGEEAINHLIASFIVAVIITLFWRFLDGGGGKA